MAKLSFAEVFNRSKSAVNKANMAIKKAQTKADEIQARRLKNKAEREQEEIRKLRDDIARLKREQGRDLTKSQLRERKRRVDDLRIKLSYKDRVFVGIKRSAEKKIDKSLKKHGL